MSRMIRRATLVLMTLAAGAMCGCSWDGVWDSIQAGAFSAVQDAANARVAAWLDAIGGMLPVV